MQDRTITFVMAGGDGQRLLPLTSAQPKALVPFGGVFRILDFAISNVLNAQLRRIHVLTQDRAEQVQTYIRAGWPYLSKEFRWDCGEDLSCLGASTRPYRGPADALFQNLAVIEKSSATHVLVVPGDQIHQMDFQQLLQQHVESRSDVTMSLEGHYLFRRQALVPALRKFVGEQGDSTFEANIVPSMQRQSTHQFEGYWRTIQTLDDYHAANMDFLANNPVFDPYTGSPRIRALAGTKQLQNSRWATNSRVALGARLVACKVSQSVISAGVRVESGAEVESSIILGNCNIGSGSRVRNAIITENTAIPPHSMIGFDEESDRRRFSLTADGIVVVIPDRDRQQYVQRRSARVATRAHLTV